MVVAHVAVVEWWIGSGLEAIIGRLWVSVGTESTQNPSVSWTDNGTDDPVKHGSFGLSHEKATAWP